MKRRNFRRLMRHARPYARKLGLGIAAALGVSVAAAVNPMIIRAAIDRGIAQSDGMLLVQLVGLLAAVGAAKAFFHGSRRQLAGEVSVRMEADLREQLYEHVQALDVGYHERVSTGQLMSRGSSDLQAVRGYLMTVPWSFTLALQVVLVTGVVTWLNWKLALLALAASPVLALATYRFAKAFEPVVWRVQQQLADIASVVEETVTGVRVVKAFGREAHQVAKLEQEAETLYVAAMDSIKLRARFAPLFNLIPHIGIVAVLWYGGHQVLDGGMTLGTLVAFNAYLVMLMWPLRALGMILAQAQRAATAAGRIFEVLDTQPGIADRPGAAALRVAGGDIRFENVRFRYPGGGPVLEGVDLHVPAGTSLALVGPTGCGKSTLVKLVPRFIEPDAGRVLIDGWDIGDVTLRSLRTKIGMVFEDTMLFSDTVRANIAFGRPDAAYDDVVAAAVTAQAHEFVSELPDAYESVVGEQGYTLSGGQRQRIAIARAILMDPRILILDDATSSVDARVEAAIREGLGKAMAGRTTLIVARRPATAALADRVAYMEAGRIVAVGTHAELFASSADYRAALSSPDPSEREAGDVAERVS